MEYTRPFARMLRGLEDSPIIVEVGCAHHMPDNPSAYSYGSSSLAFAEFAAQHGGHLYSVDIEQSHLVICRRLIDGLEQSATLICGDGEKAIHELDVPRIDLLYIDGPEGGDIAAGQLRAALPLLHQSKVARIGFDDCCLAEPEENVRNSNIRVSTVLRDIESFGLRFLWHDGYCMCFTLSDIEGDPTCQEDPK